MVHPSTSRKAVTKAQSIAKCPTGIPGLDEITGGGLPKGRPTLICGGAGCGKTLLAMEFLIRGATQYGEPGVFMCFEETEKELAQNVRSLGFDLPELVKRKKIAMDYVRIERSEIEETGEYDLEGLFVRLGLAIDTVKAKRVVLDTIESLFSGLSNTSILRAELRRMFRFLKDRGVTAIITGERGESMLTRHGLEEYVSDCVIVLDHRVNEQLSTRRLRVVKYRGSTHGTNEYPFLIDEHGINVLPITSLGLKHVASSQRISTGIERLDAMMGGKGCYRGSSVLVSGTAGTGKTSVAAHFVDAACRRGERCLYFAFEESPSQIMRNMRSIGIDLEPWVKRGRLQFECARPSLYGLEMHLAAVHKAIDGLKPAVVVIDPLTNLVTTGTRTEARSMLLRLVDYVKTQNVTALFTSLTHGGQAMEATEVGISSLMDTWLLLRDLDTGGERNRVLHLLKSRGMAHSNQVREFVLTDQGVKLIDVYLGSAGVMTGSARVVQEAKDRAAVVARQEEAGRKQQEIDCKRKEMEAQIAALRAQFEAEKGSINQAIEQDQLREHELTLDRKKMAASRKADKA